MKMIIIINITSILKGCYDRKGYKKFGRNKIFSRGK